MEKLKNIAHWDLISITESPELYEDFDPVNGADPAKVLMITKVE